METQRPEENFEGQGHSMLHKRAQMRTHLSKGESQVHLETDVHSF